MVQNIYRARFHKEQSEQELILFKFGVLYKKLPTSLSILEESPPRVITSILDPVASERLSSQYTRIIQNTKEALMSIYTTAMEIKKEEYHTEFESLMSSFWNYQHSLPKNERFNTKILALIDERQRNITQCVKHIYSFKSNFFIATETIHISSTKRDTTIHRVQH